jgi:anti-sigma-K factor RskA
MDSENYGFSEIAPLYALGLLDQETCRWVEVRAAADPDLAVEIAQLQVLANAVPVGAAPQTASVKDRLLSQLGLAGWPGDAIPSEE